eukprot:TRINITY_DN2831_c0_g1_i1.p1 TRINITY_DN2831_c0_g1~~TRINITY_DN2831_c0_g1_i1.p1  ORF type:complete len:402 (+),score=106.82 TRINITY_DN2831_c0_g1_i1:89-1294(+)
MASLTVRALIAIALVAFVVSASDVAESPVRQSKATAAELTANPCNRPLKVLIVHAFSIPAWTPDVVNTIASTNRIDINSISTFDATAATPTLATMQEYDVVLLSPDSNWFNANALGNRLNNYINAGGAVVVMAFEFGRVGGPGFAIGGNWNSSGWDPLVANGTSVSGGGPISVTADVLTNPIFSGLLSGSTVQFNSGSSTYRSSPTTLAPGATQLAHYATGEIFAASRPINATRNVVALNFFPPSQAARADFWVSGGGQLMANAIVYAACGDLTATRLVGLSAAQACTLNHVTLSAVLQQDVTFVAIEGKEVTLELAGVASCSAVTDANGVATCNIALPANSNYNLLATFTGDAGTQPTSSDTVISITCPIVSAATSSKTSMVFALAFVMITTVLVFGRLH